MTIEKITDHAQRLKNRLPRFLDGSSNLNALLDIAGGRFQELETQLFKLLDERHLSVAVGAQLDGLGEILDLPRKVGQTDPSYRQDLIGQAGQLSLSGEVESLIASFLDLSLATFLTVFEYYPAAILLVGHYDADPVDPNIDQSIVEAMARVRAAGVELDLRYAEETTYFWFSDAADVDGNGNAPLDTNHGFGDEVLTGGGGLARLIR